MKPVALAALAAITLARTHAQAPAAESALVITAVFHGPLEKKVPKGIELYARAAVPDLSRYGLEVANNGAPAVGPEIGFPAVAVPAHTFLHVESTTPGFRDYFGFPPDYADFFMSVNGNDAVVLYLDGEIVDAFGESGLDGSGEAWEYTTSYAYRVDGTPPNGGHFTPAQFAMAPAGALAGCPSDEDCAVGVPLRTYTEQALPVTLTALAAEPSATGATLTWTAATQRDNDYFAVEVSAAGEVYAEVGRVAGAGTTSEAADYAFAYETSASGLHYFRLRQVDHDGREELSEVVTAVLGESPSGLHVAGAPRGGALALEVARAGTLEVVDLVGRRWRRVSVAEAGAHELDVSALPAGVYVVTDGYTSRRFAKGW